MPFATTTIGLNEPIDDMLADVQSDMPFCLCWANESWTRRWDAADHHVLIEQKYLPKDDSEFIQDVAPLFKDARYLRVDGKPLLIVYRVQHMPNALRSVKVWRDYCRTFGIGEIHLCAALTHGNEDYQSFGFDSGVEFPPHNMRTESVANNIRFQSAFFGYVLQYADVANSFLNRVYVQGSRVFKTVFPSWDNTARTGSRAVVILNGTPQNFAVWFSRVLAMAKLQNDKSDKLVFINAWNEWAEGCHLEPDRLHGRSFLEALKGVKEGVLVPSKFEHTEMPDSKESKVSLWADLTKVLAYHAGRLLGASRNRVNRYPLLRRCLLPVVKLFKRWAA
jgi:lipopolysaccharide biosynthesis protein